MNKTDLIASLSQKENLSNKEAAEVINTILNVLAGSLEKGESIEIRGFGSFSIRECDSYTGRNPKTGEKITVKSKKAYQNVLVCLSREIPSPCMFAAMSFTANSVADLSIPGCIDLGSACGSSMLIFGCITASGNTPLSIRKSRKA